jgi:acetyl-CoA C-acetyltransferase
MDASRVPVIVGVGQINDRPADDEAGLDSFELMAAALARADADGGGGWLQNVDALSVVAQLSYPDLIDIPARLAHRFAAAPRLCEQTRYPMGESPVTLLNQAAQRIAAGESQVAAIVGGEALRTAARRAKAPDANAVRDAAGRAAKPLRQRYGIVAPADIYPLYENACRAAWGQSLAEAQRESAEIWSLMSRVAASAEHAWLHQPRTAADILATTTENRPIAFPYTKLMVANPSVNQGAGFIVASLAKARDMGVREERLVYVGAGAAAREPGDILARDRYDHAPSMQAALTSVLAFNHLEPPALKCVELYSCFPCVPKLARRILDWPLDRPVTVFGGLTFGGAPVGNYMSHAIAAMSERLRNTEDHGLLFGNGGLATTSHALIISRDPAIAANAARDYDVQPRADALRGPAPPLLETYQGPGEIETYTIFYDRAGAATNGVVIARTRRRERFLARVRGEDQAAVARLTSGASESVGASGAAALNEDGLSIWRFE